VPVYEQISRQIAFAIASGGIEVGQLVPSVRSMSRDLAVNPNTVARAYRQLQDAQIIESVRGEGMLVTPDAVIAKAVAVRANLTSHGRGSAEPADRPRDSKNGRSSGHEVQKDV